MVTNLEILAGDLDYIQTAARHLCRVGTSRRASRSLQKGRSSCSVHNGLERVKQQAVRLLRKMLLEGTVVGGEK